MRLGTALVLLTIQLIICPNALADSLWSFPWARQEHAELTLHCSSTRKADGITITTRSKDKAILDSRSLAFPNSETLSFSLSDTELGGEREGYFEIAEQQSGIIACRVENPMGVEHAWSALNAARTLAPESYRERVIFPLPAYLSEASIRLSNIHSVSGQFEIITRSSAGFALDTITKEIEAPGDEIIPVSLPQDASSIEVRSPNPALEFRAELRLGPAAALRPVRFESSGESGSRAMLLDMSTREDEQLVLHIISEAGVSWRCRWGGSLGSEDPDFPRCADLFSRSDRKQIFLMPTHFGGKRLSALIEVRQNAPPTIRLGAWVHAETPPTTLENPSCSDREFQKRNTFYQFPSGGEELDKRRQRMEEALEAERRFDFAAALASYRAAIEEDPFNPCLRERLVRVLVSSGADSSARQELEQLREITGENFFVLEYAAFLDSLNGAFDAALARLARVREIAPRDCGIASTSVSILLKAGRMSEAEAIISNADSTAQRCPPLLLFRADRLEAHGDQFGAAKLRNQALMLARSDLAAYRAEPPLDEPTTSTRYNLSDRFRILAQAEDENGNSGVAAQNFKTALDLDPADRAAYIDYVRFLVRGKSVDEALRLTQDLLGKGIARADLYVARSFFHRTRGELGQAAAALERAQTLDANAKYLALAEELTALFEANTRYSVNAEGTPIPDPFTKDPELKALAVKLRSPDPEEAYQAAARIALNWSKEADTLLEDYIGRSAPLLLARYQAGSDQDKHSLLFLIRRGGIQAALFLPMLMNEATSSQPERSTDAIAVLRAAGERAHESIPVLMLIAKGEKHGCSTCAIGALPVIAPHSTAVKNLLLHLTGSPERGARIAAISGLETYCRAGSDVEARLLTLFSDGDEGARSAALRAHARGCKELEPLIGCDPRR